MKNKKKYNLGMTLPELVLALLMLSAFTGITVMVVEYTSRFFQPFNDEAKEEYISSNRELKDMLNDHYQINKSIDSIIEILSEPGILGYSPWFGLANQVTKNLCLSPCVYFA